jgi:hypothetical protein
LEYFLAGKDYLTIKKGIVQKVNHITYSGSKRRLYTRTEIYLAGSDKRYFLTDRADFGGYVNVENGDSIVLYTRKWYQFIYNYSFENNIYYIERSGQRLYNNLSAWKSAGFSLMCFFGGCAFFLTLIYLDQVKDIFISNLFFRRRRKMERRNKLYPDD